MAIICLLAMGGVHGSQAEAAGTTGAAFLKLGSGARPTAMSGAFSAVADDINALAWNPAGIGLCRVGGVMTSYTMWFTDLRYNYAGGVFPLGGDQALGAQVTMLGLGDFSGYTVDGAGAPVAAAAFSARDISGSFSYGFSLAKDAKQQLLVGVSAKFISSSVADVSGTAFAADAGVLWLLQKGNVRIAAVVRHFGTALQFASSSAPLPFMGAFGLAVKGADDLLLSGELEIPSDHSMRVSGGAEWVLERLVSLRAGYGIRVDGSEYLGSLMGWTAGIGFHLSPLQLDYAFAPYGSLGNTHHISLGIRFGEEDQPPKVIKTTPFPVSQPVGRPVNIPTKPKVAVAVLDFVTKEVSAGMGETGRSFIEEGLFQSGKFRLVERSALQKILKEQAFQKSGCTTVECAVEIGKLLNVQYVVVGRMDKSGGYFVFSSKLVEVSSSEIVRSSMQDFRRDEDIRSAAKIIVQKLVAGF